MQFIRRCSLHFNLNFNVKVKSLFISWKEVLSNKHILPSWKPSSKWHAFLIRHDLVVIQHFRIRNSNILWFNLEIKFWKINEKPNHSQSILMSWIRNNSPYKHETQKFIKYIDFTTKTFIYFKLKRLNKSSGISFICRMNSVPKTVLHFQIILKMWLDSDIIASWHGWKFDS